ncbi:MAG: hypothetical protein ACYSUF_11670 [Planctomycetota bacterium]|jgi:hypothetical protein
MLTRSASAVALAMLSLAGLMTPPAGGATALTSVRVASGLAKPVLATHAPGDLTRLFIIEQRGLIRI